MELRLEGRTTSSLEKVVSLIDQELGGWNILESYLKQILLTRSIPIHRSTLEDWVIETPSDGEQTGEAKVQSYNC